MSEMTALSRLGIRVDVDKVAGGADRLTEAFEKMTAAAREAEEAFVKLQRLIQSPLILEQSEAFKSTDD